MSYLATFVRQNMPELESFPEDLPNVHVASKVELNWISSEVRKWKEELEQLGQQLYIYAEDKENSSEEHPMKVS